MKIIKLPINVGKEDKDKALNEGEILRKYPHPNIVRFVESFVKEDGLYSHICIVMEHINGYNLKEIIQVQGEQKLEESVICGFIVQLVNSLDYLNDQGVAHRDLKAENVKVTKDGLLKLLDFG